VNEKINAATVWRKVAWNTCNLTMPPSTDHFSKPIMQFMALWKEYWSFLTNCVPEKTFTTLTGGQGPLWKLSVMKALWPNMLHTNEKTETWKMPSLISQRTGE